MTRLMNAVEAKEKYELELISKGASFVAVDPDKNALIVGVERPEVIEFAKKLPVKVEFVKGGEMWTL